MTWCLDTLGYLCYPKNEGINTIEKLKSFKEDVMSDCYKSPPQFGNPFGAEKHDLSGLHDPANIGRAVAVITKTVEKIETHVKEAFFDIGFIERHGEYFQAGVFATPFTCHAVEVTGKDGRYMGVLVFIPFSITHLDSGKIIKETAKSS